MKREYLIQLRNDRGMSQQEVAEGLDISRQYYSLVEAGKRKIRMDIKMIKELARCFDVQDEVILEGEQQYENL